MGDALEFDDAATSRLEAIYASADVRRRRALVQDALGARHGERILDIGCGPGFYVDEIAETVGPGGHVTGVDPSASMLATAARRTAGRANTTLVPGEATALPLPGSSFDAAVCVQVLEYVEDVHAALTEARRVLEPGGRLVIWDIDWTTLSWFSTDPERMGRILRAWDRHLAHPALPQTLEARLRDAGFTDIGVQGHAFVNTDVGPDAYGGGIIPLIEAFVTGRGVPVEEAAAWRAELEDLSAAGSYFFAITQCCFTATAPGPRGGLSR